MVSGFSRTVTAVRLLLSAGAARTRSEPIFLLASSVMRSYTLFPWLAAASAAAVLAVSPACQAPQAQRPRFDVVIAHGRIVDGTGAPWFRGDIGIVGDRIAALGALGDATAETRIDATNLVVSPGFIDLLGQSEFNHLVDGRAASKILQGVTTEVTGEGSSIAPVNDRMIKEASANAKYFGITQDWRTLADYFKRIE